MPANDSVPDSAAAAFTPIEHGAGANSSTSEPVDARAVNALVRDVTQSAALLAPPETAAVDLHEPQVPHSLCITVVAVP